MDIHGLCRNKDVNLHDRTVPNLEGFGMIGSGADVFLTWLDSVACPTLLLDKFRVHLSIETSALPDVTWRFV